MDSQLVNSVGIFFLLLPQGVLLTKTRVTRDQLGPNVAVSILEDCSVLKRFLHATVTGYMPTGCHFQDSCFSARNAKDSGVYLS